MALQGSLGDVNIEAIDTTISDTAVDVFIYDTRKDSDGGAWRKRTQHTSWYNETLNTATRGSRREFPVVAVIVLESGGSTEGTSVDFTIYDGDDPSLPLWMQFRFVIGAGSNSRVAALNGKIVYGATDNGVLISDFILDQMTLHNHVHRHIYSPISPGRLGRTTQAAHPESGISGYNIVNQVVNDVAMTVVPGAPIDSLTGLPSPTIAVATDGGVSIIQDNGTVHNRGESTSSSETFRVAFTKGHGLLYFAGYNSGGHAGLVGYFPLDRLFVTGDPNQSADHSYTGNNNQRLYVGPNNWNHYTSRMRIGMNYFHELYQWNYANYGMAHPAGMEDDSFAVGGDQGAGLTLVRSEEGDVSNGNHNGMVCYIKTNFNTGWQQGKIKLATLCSVDGSDISNTNYVTNGTFDSVADGTDGYDNGDGTVDGYSPILASLSVVSNQLRVTSTNSGGNWVGPGILYGIDADLVSGKQYVVTATINTSNISFPQAGAIRIQRSRTSSHSSLTLKDIPLESGTQTYRMTFTAVQVNMGIHIACWYGDGSGYFTIDDFSVEEAEPDRSPIARGLARVGNVTTAPVATGADLLSYGNFSGSSYMFQPDNGELAFGTGNFSISLWAKSSGSNVDSYIWQYDNGGTTAMHFLPNYNGGLLFNLAGDFTVVGSPIRQGEWTHYIMGRNNGTAHIYENGTRQGSWAAGSTLVTGHLTVGNRTALTAAFTGSLALFKVSASWPSDKQIKYMYEQERQLFQAGAKCSLSGDTNNITGLGYDTYTQNLHVGTSAGQSTFRGLIRTDSNSDSVTTALDVNNRMVVSQ